MAAELGKIRRHRRLGQLSQQAQASLLELGEKTNTGQMGPDQAPKILLKAAWSPFLATH